MKKRELSLLVIALTILGLIAGVLFFYKISKDQHRSPQKSADMKPEKPTKTNNTPQQAKIIEPKKQETSNTTTEENATSISDNNKINVPGQLHEKKGATLQADPEALSIKVAQGAREKGEFQLRNTGTKETLVNIYKSQPNSSDDILKKRIDGLISYRKNKLPGKTEAKDLTKAALFNGTPWLMTFPYYETLEASGAKNIEVAVDARDLEAGEYKVGLIILGSEDNESLVLPVNIIVEKAAKIKISKIMVNDGLSDGTTGNSDHIPNPGEKVLFTVYLNNTGAAAANNLTITITPKDNNLKLLGDNNVVQIPYLGSQGEAQVNILAEIGPNANSEIPPTVSLAIADSEGTKTIENFYLGDPEKIHYPLGWKQNKNFKAPDF